MFEYSPGPSEDTVPPGVELLAEAPDLITKIELTDGEAILGKNEAVDLIDSGAEVLPGCFYLGEIVIPYEPEGLRPAEEIQKRLIILGASDGVDPGSREYTAITVIEEGVAEVIMGGEAQAANAPVESHCSMGPGQEVIFGRAAVMYPIFGDLSISRFHFSVTLSPDGSVVTIKDQSKHGTIVRSAAE